MQLKLSSIVKVIDDVKVESFECQLYDGTDYHYYTVTTDKLCEDHIQCCTDTDDLSGVDGITSVDSGDLTNTFAEDY